MKIVVLDGYTENPGDLSWGGLEELGDLTIISNNDTVSLLECYNESTYLNILNRSNDVDIKTIDLEKECISFMAIEQPVARDSFMTPSMNGGKLEGVKRRINAFYRH